MSGIAQYGAALDALYQNFSAAFEQGLVGMNEKNKPWWNQVAMEVPSDTDTEVHEWIQQIPGVREWSGDRVLNAISEAGYALKNRVFEDTVQVSKDRLDDRKISADAVLMRMLGYQFAKFPDRTIYTELLAGYASLKCFDGLPFFDNSHPVNVLDSSKGTFDNLYASTALTTSNFETVYAAMTQFKNADGNVMGLLPDTLIVPPQLRTTAYLIANAAVVPNTAGTASQDNPNRGVVDVMVLPELGGESTTWYLAALGGPLKPLLLQTRAEPVFEVVFGPDSDHCKKTRKIAFGADCRKAFGYTLPQLMIRCTA